MENLCIFIAILGVWVTSVSHIFQIDSLQKKNKRLNKRISALEERDEKRKERLRGEYGPLIEDKD